MTEIQFIKRAGKREYAIIPYGAYLQLQADLEEYRVLKATRAGKGTPRRRRVVVADPDELDPLPPPS